ncbi:hypothetical protein [Haladaptatus halobius]|uniref:hypothetical protein n=1 Tax=Haladaptatus halobius TaxID=2884875 RepID=UPI001D0A48CD|nr:hypothetical protein [Haladaptatus halobius]
MTERPEGSSGPLDIPTLTVLAQRAATHPLVSNWQFRPDSITPRVLELQVDSEQYPTAIHDVRVDIRWFEGGDYSVHYLEISADETWQCRWDRHPKPNTPTGHFHPPPTAEDTVEPSPLDADHHLDVLFAVLDWIGERVQELYDV